MARYSLTVETTSNATAGSTGGNTAIQILAASGKKLRLLGVLIKPQQLSDTQQSGRWVVDRISAVSGGSTLVPLQLDPEDRASEITDTTKTIATAVDAAPTVVATTGVAIVSLADGWNWFHDTPIWADESKGFAIRRSTAPTGAQVVTVCMVWEEP